MPAALMESARVLVGESKSRLQAARRVAAEQRYATLRAVSASLAAAFEVPAMLQRKARLAGLSEEPTPCFALEVQRGSMPGHPGAKPADSDMAFPLFPGPLDRSRRL